MENLFYSNLIFLLFLKFSTTRENENVVECMSDVCMHVKLKLLRRKNLWQDGK